ATEKKEGNKRDHVFVYGEMDVPTMGQNLFGRCIGRDSCNSPDTHLIKFLKNTLARKDLTLAGFRDSFGSWAELNYPQYDIAAEMCLGHATGNAVRRAYRRHGGRNAPKLPEPSKLEKQQRLLMEEWGKLLEP